MLLISCSKNEKAIKEEIKYTSVNNSCWSKWNANDTMRNSALLAVQIQMKKIDQLSLAPTDSSGAISLLCRLEAEKAVEQMKSNTVEDKSKFYD